jgi:hypothetical protein
MTEANGDQKAPEFVAGVVVLLKRDGQGIHVEVVQQPPDGDVARLATPFDVQSIAAALWLWAQSQSVHETGMQRWQQAQEQQMRQKILTRGGVH